MKTALLAGLAAATFLLSVGASPAAADVNATIGKDLPAGMTVHATIGGDGCNCTGARSGTVGRSGTVTVNIVLRCDPPPPNDKCRVFARGLDEPTNTQYHGDGPLTPTATPGLYLSRFNIAP